MDLAARLIAAQEGRATGGGVVEFPDVARVIRTNRKRKNRGESTDPALDGHLGLCRMKAAAALALLHGGGGCCCALLGSVILFSRLPTEKDPRPSRRGHH